MHEKPLQMRIAAMTHPGLIRTHNEDCIGVTDWSRASPMASPVIIECSIDEPRLCVVADGLGGHSAGEVASTLVVRELAAAASEFKGPESVKAALHAINKRLYDIMQASPQLIGMGSTIAGLVTIDLDICLFNVGDSRVYLAVGDYLRLLSKDDSADAKNSDPSQRTGINSHGITQSLGGLSSFSPIDPHLIIRPAKPEDRYLLCSDGLTDMLDLDAIEASLTKDARSSVERLVQEALTAGGVDNISVIIVEIILP